MNAKKNIFVVGLDEFNRKYLKDVSRASEYEFHQLLTFDEVVPGPNFDIPFLLQKAQDQISRFPGSIDAIVSYWDFPAVLMMPVLRKKMDLPGPELESILRCEHKYWSRLEQKKAIPENVPKFELIDPFDEQALSKLNLPFPFWIKPVKAHSSLLGYRINNERQFYQCMQEMRVGITGFAEALNAIMKYADLPKEVSQVHGGHCIAEEIISAGKQCTLEGYVLNGNVKIYGTVDSIRGRNRSSFERYEYPTRLPKAVQEQMQELAIKVIRQTGLNQSPFNIEFFYNPKQDRIFLLEINARISKSHSPLFERVDGVANHEVMINVALGEHPSFPTSKGAFTRAAKFMPRIYGRDKATIILESPEQHEVEAVAKQFPGTEIQMHVQKGMKASDSCEKETYSYQLASIFMGANSHQTLMRQYRNCLPALDIRWRNPDDT